MFSRLSYGLVLLAAVGISFTGWCLGSGWADRLPIRDNAEFVFIGVFVLLMSAGWFLLVSKSRASQERRSTLLVAILVILAIMLGGAASFLLFFLSCAAGFAWKS